MHTITKYQGKEPPVAGRPLMKLERSGPIFVPFFSYLKALICFLVIKLLLDIPYLEQKMNCFSVLTENQDMISPAVTILSRVYPLTEFIPKEKKSSELERLKRSGLDCSSY